jgi:hypothetical protein
MAAGASVHARVAVFLERHCLLAELNTGPRRVSDVLNDPTRQQIVLERVRVTRPDRPGDPFVLDERMIVRKPEIQAVLIMSEPPGQPENRLVQFVAKTLVRVGIVLPAIDVTGSFHVAGKTDPIHGLLDAPETIIAISDAQVR